jgi:predicted dehydrogenase
MNERSDDLAPDPSRFSPTGIAERLAQTTAAKRQLLELDWRDRMQVVVEGAGSWVGDAYRTAILGAARGLEQEGKGRKLAVHYADDTSSKEDGPTRPDWYHGRKAAGIASLTETYLDKALENDKKIYGNLRPDVVFVVTPDSTHASIARHWIGRAPVVFVEKPFTATAADADALLNVLGRQRYTAVLGLDHYQLYALPIPHQIDRLMAHLGGALASVRFFMVERRPIERGRERTLEAGLTRDLLPHLLALLSFFGEVKTIGDIAVRRAGQYEPLVSRPKDAVDASQDRSIADTFGNETGARIAFTFEDASGSGIRVPVEAVVGKGFARDVKYFEVEGVNGNAARIDFGPVPMGAAGGGYPWDTLFLIGQPPGGATTVTCDDPYRPNTPLAIEAVTASVEDWRVQRRRYEHLIVDLLDGSDTAVPATLQAQESGAIVDALQRICDAIHRERSTWQPYGLQVQDPLACM